jgi:thiol-disulfide isomerase/thioredoxin
MGLETDLRLILLLLALLGTAGCDRQKAESQQGGATAARGSEGEQREGVDRSHHGKPAPGAQFHDPDGGAISLAKFRGVPVLVNLWASWCAPCVKELPTLQKLEKAQAKDGRLGVIAVSQDMAPKASVDAFLASKTIARFAAFHDPDMALSSALGAQILPTSVLFDAKGREVWRYVGDVDWTSEEAASLLAEGRLAGAAKAR